MGQFKIVYDKSGCIGAGTCATIDKTLWSVGPDGTATLKGATQKGSTYELILDDAQMKQEQAVAGSCPAGCIKVQRL